MNLGYIRVGYSQRFRTIEAVDDGGFAFPLSGVMRSTSNVQCVEVASMPATPAAPVLYATHVSAPRIVPVTSTPLGSADLLAPIDEAMFGGFLVAPGITDEVVPDEAVVDEAPTVVTPTVARPYSALFGIAAAATIPFRTAPLFPGQARADADTESKYWEWWGAARFGARIVTTRAQRVALALVGVLLAAMIVVWPKQSLMAAIAFMITLYAVTGIYKFFLLLRGESAVAHGTDADAASLSDADLPVYSVLVPLHREDRILPLLINRLNELDYPHDRLQIMLLVEMDDERTINAAHRLDLPSHISLMVMPPGQPRTKPRALNVGLREALGKYIVIFDAEDRPERDQLRKAVAAFNKLPPDVVCVQGRLNFYNWAQSLLTRLFAVDYAVWYDQLLPGLTLSGRMNAGTFVPLGGTSNHFRVDVLRKVGGWDPFNVTEDCDLGARLGRMGMRVAMLDSTTWEEAVPHARPWIRQRSRWIKGYIQTYLVHMRNPRRLLSQLGVRGFMDFQMLVGASCFVMLVNPLMWALTMVYFAGLDTSVDTYIQSLFPAPLYYTALLSLVVGNFVFFFSNAYVCLRHDHLHLTRYALLSPFYWFLMSLGAWAGMFSLIRNPFYWAKTEHGVSLAPGEQGLALASASSSRHSNEGLTR